jgi:acetolactate synthase I/II/III large subunit
LGNGLLWDTAGKGQMKVCDWIASELVRIGVTHVFTLPGGFSQHLNDSIAHTPGLTPVYMLHESGAAFAAAHWAAYTGKLGVCVVTSGPGSTNALTGIASAYQDSLPVLVISGEANMQNIDWRKKYQLRQGGPQDVPIESMTRLITKGAATLTTSNYLMQSLFRLMVQTAVTDRRGPVWVAVPLDIQGKELEV